MISQKIKQAIPAARRASASNILLVASVGLLFAFAAAVRLYDVHKTFVGLLPVREYRAAIIARDIYVAGNPDFPTWQQEVAHASRAAEWVLEPPILEGLTAATYHILGGEQLWVARVYASFFWLVSGLIFWDLARRLFGSATALLLTAYYLFVPIGIYASKSFQPDTLMMMLYLASLWAILYYDQHPTHRRLGLAAAVSALAIFVRPLCMFPIAGAFFSLFIFRYSQDSRRNSTHHLGMFALSVLFALAYYLYNWFVSGALSGQTEITFQPHLLFLRAYWENWLSIEINTVTLIGAMAALLGLSLLNSPRLRWLLCGLWGSYFLFGLIFNYHISTHNYYHLQVLPTVALSAGPLLAFVIEKAQQMRFSWLRMAWISGIVFFFIFLVTWQTIQRGRVGPDFEPPALAAEIGDLVHHSTKTLYLARYYGRPLEYYGQISGRYWLRADNSLLYLKPAEKSLTIAERLESIPFTPEYFIITDFREYDRHHADLKEYLGTCPIVVERDNLLIYEFCSPDYVSSN